MRERGSPTNGLELDRSYTYPPLSGACSSIAGPVPSPPPREKGRHRIRFVDRHPSEGYATIRSVGESAVLPSRRVNPRRRNEQSAGPVPGSKIDVVAS